MKKLQMQVLFNKMYRGLRKQGFWRSQYSGSCVYRADRTAECPTRCAIGHIIPDWLYDQELEGKTPGARSHIDGYSKYNNMVAGEAIMKAARVKYTENNVKFLEEVQHAHDTGKTPKQMRDQLSAVAARYGLEIPA